MNTEDPPRSPWIRRVQAGDLICPEMFNNLLDHANRVNRRLREISTEQFLICEKLEVDGDANGPSHLRALEIAPLTGVPGDVGFRTKDYDKIINVAVATTQFGSVVYALVKRGALFGIVEYWPEVHRGTQKELFHELFGLVTDANSEKVKMEVVEKSEALVLAICVDDKFCAVRFEVDSFFEPREKLDDVVAKVKPDSILEPVPGRMGDLLVADQAGAYLVKDFDLITLENGQELDAIRLNLMTRPTGGAAQPSPLAAPVTHVIFQGPSTDGKFSSAWVDEAGAMTLCQLEEDHFEIVSDGPPKTESRPVLSDDGRIFAVKDGKVVIAGTPSDIGAQRIMPLGYSLCAIQGGVGAVTIFDSLFSGGVVQDKKVWKTAAKDFVDAVSSSGDRYLFLRTPSFIRIVNARLTGTDLEPVELRARFKKLWRLV